MDHIIYRNFTEADAPAVVEMWKDSLKAWPPGFFGASEMTEDTVLMEERSSGKLFTVLALMDDRVVGYCMTSPYGGEPDASYVNLLNVVPDMHGMGIGKVLLLDAVKRTAELGLNRIDLHTWPANMKAVPLYKKTGFFWVPDTEVYMQNYMPYLLGRPEFQDFLQGEDWYGCFRRELLVEEDRQSTDSGREVFTYWFRRGDSEFVAEFDRKGRVLSRMEYPKFRAGLTVVPGHEFLVGRKYSVSLSCKGFDASGVSLEYPESMKCETVGDGRYEFEPLAVRLERSIEEPAETFSVQLPDSGPKLGIGINGVEEVAFCGDPLQYLLPGADSVKLDLKKLGDVSSIAATWSLDGSSGEVLLDLSDDTFQSVRIPVPAMDRGIHTLEVRMGEQGYPERIVLAVGQWHEPVRVLDTRRSAVILGKDMALLVHRKGARGVILAAGDTCSARRLGSVMLGAGPPVIWNSDLPKQTYELQLGEDQVQCRTQWPSRKGMTHRVRFSMEPSGLVEAESGVDNLSGTDQRIHFRARTRWSSAMEPGTQLIPLPDGIMEDAMVFNQVPDPMEDYGGRTDNLGAPWLGRYRNGTSLMEYFSGWQELEVSMPGTAETTVSAGCSLDSPPLRVLKVDGGPDDLIRTAMRLGWETGDALKKCRFFRSNLRPFMLSGESFSLDHPLYGERDAFVSVNGKQVARGKVKRNSGLTGSLEGSGITRVELSIAGRSMVMPVFLIKRESGVKLDRKDGGDLQIANGRLRVLIDPSARGHAYSILSGGREYLYSSHPEPAEFCWEKPWFGGIVPGLSSNRNRPFPLHREMPVLREISSGTEVSGEKGFAMVWNVDHKRFGSYSLHWSITMLPEVPVLRTVLRCTAKAGAYTGGEVDIRGFLKPGGNLDGTVLTCQSFPNLQQGRKHNGAWADMGKWARVSGNDAFIEAYSLKDGVLFGEDYGEHGCHLAVFGNRDAETSLEMLWLFGSRADDRDLAGVIRAHM